MIPKYRAWYKKGTLPMLTVSLISYDQEFIDAYIDEEAKGGTEMSLDFKDITLMQSTGLFDKNGVDVFIGDIVRCSQGCPHEVVFIREFGGMFVGGMPAIYLSGLQEGYAWTGDEEVIGNIYENPDLVEVRHEQTST